MTAGPAIEVDGVSLVYDGRPPVVALDRVSVTVGRGQFVSLVGPSGCGKSTLLRVLAGLARPQEGAARIAGADVIGRAGNAAFMPQRDLLLPWRRALGNAILGAELTGVPRAEVETRARALFPTFGLEGFERAWPATLSGGMRQRLALLRTFLTPRDVLLLDEPFGALDAITRREMHAWLQEVWQRDRRTVLLVTHDIDEAITLSDTVFVMSPRPGRIVDAVTVDLPRPRTSRDSTTPAFTALKARVLEGLEAPR